MVQRNQADRAKVIDGLCVQGRWGNSLAFWGRPSRKKAHSVDLEAGCRFPVCLCESPSILTWDRSGCHCFVLGPCHLPSKQLPPLGLTPFAKHELSGWGKGRQHVALRGSMHETQLLGTAPCVEMGMDWWVTLPNTDCYSSSITGTFETPFEHSDCRLQALFRWATCRFYGRSYLSERAECPKTLRCPVTWACVVEARANHDGDLMSGRDRNEDTRAWFCNIQSNDVLE